MPKTTFYGIKKHCTVGLLLLVTTALQANSAKFYYDQAEDCVCTQIIHGATTATITLHDESDLEGFLTSPTLGFSVRDSKHFNLFQWLADQHLCQEKSTAESKKLTEMLTDLIHLIVDDNICYYLVTGAEKASKAILYKESWPLTAEYLEPLFPDYFALFKAQSSDNSASAFAKETYARIYQLITKHAHQPWNKTYTENKISYASYFNLILQLLAPERCYYVGMPLECFMLAYPAAEIPFLLSRTKTPVHFSENISKRLLDAAHTRCGDNRYSSPLDALAYLLYVQHNNCFPLAPRLAYTNSIFDYWDQNLLDHLGTCIALLAEHTIDLIEADANKRD